MNPSIQMLKRKVRFKHGRWSYVWKASGDGVTAHGTSVQAAREIWRRKWELTVAKRVAERMTYSPEENK
jgi:hypothetical protein